MLKKYDLLPECFKNSEVEKYYRVLEKKKASIFVKRVFDFSVSLIMLVIASPVIILLMLAIALDSPGNPIFRQERVTTYGKKFYIYKFRTMVMNAEKLGSQVTVDNDPRVTKTGRFLRKYRLDELLQLINILKGEMSFVGTRPEVMKYVSSYTKEMYATLLLPAGVTSLASIRYKDEEKLLKESSNADETYIKEVLPEKMKFNLEYMEKFSFFYDIKLMFMTVFAVIEKDGGDTVEEAECEKEVEV